MATEFPPNLDDGELWLPSDIIPEVGSLRQISCGPDIESLAKQLAAFGLLDLYRSPNVPVPTVKPLPDPAEGFRPVTGFRYGYDGYRVPVGTGAYLQGPRTFQQFKTSKPVQAQVVDGFGQRRGMALRQNIVPAPFYPFRAKVSDRVCAGTGVFLPRVANSEIKRKPTSMKVGDQKKQPVRNRVGGKQMQVMPLIQPPSEMSLPQEWTY